MLYNETTLFIFYTRMSTEKNTSQEFAVLLGDEFLEEIQKRKSKESQVVVTQKRVHERPTVTWWKRDQDGQRIYTNKRRKCGSRKKVSSADVSTPSSSFLTPGPCSSIRTTYQDSDFDIQRLEDILQESLDVQDRDDQQPSFSSWSHRRVGVTQRWQQARPQNLDNLLAAECVSKMTCNHCGSGEAVIRCRECMPLEWFCADCDGLIHKHQVMHNRQNIVNGFYQSMAPTQRVIFDNGKYSICEQVCFLPTAFPQRICSCDPVDVAVSAGRSIILVCINGRYDLHVPVLTCNHCNKQWAPEVKGLSMKTTAPGMSRQAFTAMLDQRTKYYGRIGKVNPDAFQMSFLQFAYCKFEESQQLGMERFVCPACAPEMVAVAVDGNKKLYRFQKTNQAEEPAFFDGVFLAKDSEVASFVEEVRGAVKSTAGKAMCGDSHWTAARETSRQANKLDEEGVEIAVCRHGFLLKGLNMYRGEIFAYPMYLQKEFQSATFLAMDVTCRYLPYLEKVADVLDHLHPLQEMKHCLSVMHAKAHNTKCEILWSARNQEGAGTTLGEEVEQVNSFLSRCALTTKYMTKSVRTDMLTVHAMGWNERKKDTLHMALSTRFKKTVEQTLEVTEGLKKMQDQFLCSDDMLEQWVVDVKQWASSGSTSVSTGDVRGLQISIEDLFVGIRHMKHYLYRQNDRNKTRQRVTQKIAKQKKRLLDNIQKYNQVSDHDTLDAAAVVQKLANNIAESMIWPWQEHNTGTVDILTKKKVYDQKMLVSRLEEEKQILFKEMMQHCMYLKDSVNTVQSLIASTQSERSLNGLSEEGSKGLICLLKKRRKELRQKQQTVAMSYRAAIGPGPWLVEEEEADEQMDWQHDSSSDDGDDDDDDEDLASL
ncbi:hypothetical protein UPYG_G00292040 [Umbra pygmaea]|uniref:CxC3 like cysteine cluster domain-containing protein n=1 Tax=Umbra pygmaea TaxID=75934 RepID=A0ABD0WRA7_UMBPY